ncbi:MAG TPA: response regulator [Verrucomicrobiales bacterium]|nr:response regulator [Verrucomicrobiales bacterium]
MKRRILVVDDESIVAHDISECLTHMGCEVVGHALSGPDAISKAGSLRPDLIMMDIVLQGPMDGVEAATVIRQRHDIPCVFLTAYSDGAVLARAKVAAPAGYMVKPFEEAGLRSTVEIALYKVDLERALRESREWFLTTLMSIADGVVATDTEGRIKFLNPRAEALSGWMSHEAEKLTVDEVFPLIGDDGTTAKNLLHDVLKEGGTQTRDKGVVLVCRDGSKLPISDSAAPIRDREGQLVGAVLIFRDATERRRYEQGLQQEHGRLGVLVEERTNELQQINTRLLAEVEERRRAERALAARVQLERMLSSLSAQFLATRPDETEDGLMQALAQIGTFLRVDRCYIMQFGPGRKTMDCYLEWCAEEVPSMKEEFTGLETVVLPEEFEDSQNRTSGIVAFAAGPEGEGAMNAELAAQRGAGSVLWLRLGECESSHGYLCVDSVHARREWNMDSLRGLAMASGVVATALRRFEAERDKVRLQSQLQQSMKMEAVGKLSGGIAHDFNNMLLPIIGYSDMVLLRLPPDDPSVTELREVKRAAERASALTRQLLAFSRKQVARKTVFDLNDNLGNMHRMLARIIGEDINLRMELAQEAVPVKADQGQLEQVVMNLIINARDAMPNGGSIVVRTMLVDAARYPVPVIGGVASEGTYAVLSVADTGCGIAKELQDRIFEPFYTTKGMEGTGLGLSVIYGIIQEHEGGLQLSSVQGRGTTFHIFLPASKQPAPVTPADGDKPVNGHFRGSGQRVLLVEDEEAVNHLVRTALTQNGYVVTSAATVKEARALFDESSGQFEMIFSDAVLPDGNGLQLLDVFLTSNPGLRALLSSGYTDKTSLLEMARHRRISFLPKPYSLPVLFQTVAEVMEDQNAHLLD